MSRPVSLCLLAAVLGLSSAAYAGEVRGRVAVADRSVPPAQDAHYWNAWNGFIAAGPVRADLQRELSVVLRGAGGGAEPAGCRYMLRGGDLLPRTMVVKAGARFRIENNDGANHELAIEGLENGAPIRTAPGNARPLNAPAGAHAVSDALYAHVRGTIVAIDDLVACGTLDAEGAYRFPEVNPGTYQLVVYRGGEAIHDQSVEVGGGALEVSRINLD